jgi:polar amino acid transport system permease protein
MQRSSLLLLCEGAAVSAEIACLAGVLALVLAVPAGLGRGHSSRLLSWPSACYIEVFRGTSLVVQLFWLYFVLPQFGITLPTLLVAVLGLGLNYGAYGAEVVRGAIASVPKGQREAGHALGLTSLKTSLLVILPQALLLFIRPWGNLMVQLLKATSLVSLITVAELSFRAYQLNQLTLRSGEIFGAVLVLYFFMVQVIAIGTNALEWRAGHWRRTGKPAR